MSKKILRGAAQVATFGLAGKLLGIGDKKKPKTPAPVPGPQVMPLSDEERIRQARKRGIIQARGRAGRDSTILTGEKLGGY